ncbi:MAG TPA: hypothetical protein VM933_04035, partial [Acidimicrobiales bacterium]|nr:hypothetical protein [Acidimicrobiales bacterium]
RLVLVESGQNVNASGASLQACPALGTWKPGKGTLEQGPKADCAAGSVPLSRDATTGQWFADVTTVLSSGTAAVAVVPGDVGGVFHINFDAPTLDVRTEEAGGGTTGSSFDASEFTSPSSAGSSGSGQTSSSTSSGSDSFSSPGSSADTMTFVPGSSSSFTPAPSTFDAGGSTDFSGDTPDGGAVADTGADVTTGSEVAGGPPTVLQPASTSDGPSGNRAAQFAFFLVTAAVIGTAAGFARHRLTAGAG